VSQNDVIVTDHDILDGSSSLRKTPRLEEVVREVRNALQTNMIFRASKADDIKSTGPKSTGAEIAIAIAGGDY
jgi:hypothetical protein